MRIHKILFPLPLLLTACNLAIRAPTSIQMPVVSPMKNSPVPSDTAAPGSTSTPGEHSSPAGEPYELLIVTPRAFYDSMRRLAEWKTSTQLPTGILLLEDVGSLCEGRDAPERIKRCLAMYQQKSGIRYAMLAGDGDQFPIRWTSTDSDAVIVQYTSFFPADLYYADLYKADGSFDDWDANGNGYFGEIGGQVRSGPLNIDKVDLNPDIAVGRAPVSNADEAAIYVEKVIGYEKAAFQSEWARRVLAISSGGYLPDDCRREEEMITLLPGDQYAVTRLYYAGNPCQATPELTAGAIVDELNKGVGLVSFLGHGNMDLWADAVTVKDFVNVQNGKTLPLVFSGGCGTATFTAYPPGGPYTDITGVHHAGAEFGEVFAETPPQPAPIQAADNLDGIMEFSLVQTSTGVVLYVGAVTGAQFPMMFDVNKFFFEGIVQAGPRAGDAWNFAVRKYYQVHKFEQEYDHADWVVLADFHQMWKFMLFGDPSLRIGGVGQ